MPDGDRRLTDADILAHARARLKLVIDSEVQLRRLEKNDLNFSTLDQWDPSIRSARENDVNGPRPCLTIDQINQYIVQVVNDMRQGKPGINVRPQDDKSDIETAKKRLEFLKLQQRQNVAQIDDPSLDEGARLRARFGDLSPKKKQAPSLPDYGAAKAQADLYAQAVKNAQDLIVKTGDLTTFEEELARIENGRYGKLLPAQRDVLLNLAGQVDQIRENSRVQKEADEAVKKSSDESAQRTLREAEALNASAAAYKDLIDPTAKYARQLEEIQKLREKGLLPE